MEKNGYIFTRGKSKRYYVQYYVNGKKYAAALRDQDGQPITSRKKAEYAARDFLHPLEAATKADQLKKVREAVEDAEARAERLAAAEAERRRAEEERTRNERAKIADGWRLFMLCPKRPASCKRHADAEIPRNSTAGNYRAYFEHFAAWMNEERPKAVRLADVSPDDAADFMEHIRSRSAPGTFNKYLQFLRLLYDVLIKSGKLNTENPFSEIDRAEQRYNSKKPLTRRQIVKLISQADGELRLMIALGYFTGLRQGDVCTLLWGEVDLERGIIERITRKTENTVRDPNDAIVKIGIAPYLARMLAKIPTSKRKGYILPELSAMYLGDRESAINKRVCALFTRCGIPVRREGTGGDTGRRAIVETGFHSLRYSYISHHAEAGTPAPVIQKNSGHKNPAMTEHYMRISDTAAVHYAAALTLPAPEDDTIDVEAVEVEPERERLRQLAASLPLETVRRILTWYDLEEITAAKGK